MKATLSIEFTVEGLPPSNETIENALLQLTGGSGCVMSEQVDGSDEWAIMIEGIEVKMEDAQ